MNNSWNYGSHLCASLARAPRDAYWPQKEALERTKRNANPPRVNGSSGEGRHQVLKGVEDEGKIGILENCAIAWCRVLMGIATLARELNEAEIMGFSLMRLAGSRLLMMFSSSDTR
ncbi:hypothetical protein V6N13_148826 [Hibiscus sabdariffa]|uniref:Uncharacterized protein n=1 Tax=Hibiscus sabdariffa TaxID=183260 RepID=A0ABR2EJK0_9ROSI